VRARSVGIATGAYTAPDLHPSLTSRVMPILSNSMVTRPLTQQEIAACNFRTTQVLTDTRTLRFLFRFLPDNRLQIGSRSAITVPTRRIPAITICFVEGMYRKFPRYAVSRLTTSWWGWVDVAQRHDAACLSAGSEAVGLLRAGLRRQRRIVIRRQAGRRLAEQIAGKGGKQDACPIFTSQLPGHPFAPFRRIGQRMLYSAVF